nr:DUF2235 domain-containing protein [Anianabacter salinae]
MNDRLRRLLSFRPWAETSQLGYRRGRVDHVVLLDGTMSSLREGEESNVGLIYKLLREVAPSAHLSLHYEKGIQWRTWSATRDVIEGRGINRQIRRAYGLIASRYKDGDRIFLFGFSRGAYAVRSLAGVIDQLGLLRTDHATERNIREAYRHYMRGGQGEVARAFARLYCHDAAPIEMIGIFDTVKALGLRVPLVWNIGGEAHAFHNHDLGPSVRHGYHALAHDEARMAYAPVLWETTDTTDARVEQVWFRGSHGDVGGMLGGFDAARPLSNIPLVWMLERAEARGLSLPEGWRGRFATDPNAPSVGMNRGWGKAFVARRPRAIGHDPSERVHWTVTGDVPAMQMRAPAT